MLFPTALLFSHLLILVGATFTDPTQWPGYSNLPLCVQSVFPYIGCPVGCAGGCIPCDIGCGTWTCACGRDYFAAAVSAASSIAATACSTNQADGIASATSIVNGFCNQLLATPTLTGAPSPTSTATGSTGIKWFSPYSTTRLNQPNSIRTKWSG